MLRSILKKILFSPFIAKRMVKLSLILHNQSYRICSLLSPLLEQNGLHPKHRLMNYHDWFLSHIEAGWTILDVGCGNGALSYDLAKKAKRVIGVDIMEDNIDRAKREFSLDNIDYLHGDATLMDFKEEIDAVVLSNVLEHLDNRRGILKKLSQITKRFLIRVPLIDRDWITLYKMEMEIEWRLDPTHRLEYTYKSLEEELKQAGLLIKGCSIQFGEIWAEAELKPTNDFRETKN
ncbi:class I SAM-dependent methyltransferase [Thermodesulfobacteriota bacterium]